jgi:hypothetical protein
MDTFVPTIAFSSDDFPTFGRPTTVTKPDRTETRLHLPSCRV